MSGYQQLVQGVVAQLPSYHHSEATLALPAPQRGNSCATSTTARQLLHYQHHNEATLALPAPQRGNSCTTSTTTRQLLRYQHHNEATLALPQLCMLSCHRNYHSVLHISMSRVATHNQNILFTTIFPLHV